MTTVAAETKATRREVWAWYLYDFGNSAYASVVLLAVFSTYFKEGVVGGAEGSRLWGLAVGLAMLIVAVTSPILGTVADYSGAKKRFLFAFTTMSCAFTALLFFVHPGDVWLGMLFFVLAEVGYRSAQVFYNSLLPEIATPDEMGRVSGTGWAIGSAGGIVCLLLILPLIVIVGGNGVVRLSMVITALFFALSTVPLFVTLNERAEPRPLPEGETMLTVGFRQLLRTLRRIKSHREFAKFIIAFLIYNDGILMAMDFAAIMGAVLYGMTQEQLIPFMIVVQATSVIGAYVFGFAVDRVGGKRSLVISLLLMIGVMVWMYINRSLSWFFVIGAVAGFALTGVQSVSRTVVGFFSPKGRSAEFYGLFAVAGRTSSFIGPTVFGWVAAEAAILFQSRGEAALVAEQMGQRVAILSVIAFLAVGFVLLLAVRESRPGRAASEG
jgi:UMF1 family MFS transporter